MKKVLFFDVDGTLVDHASGISFIPEGVTNQIKRLKKEGHYVFIASGRPKAFISQQFMDLGFDGFILCNGSHVEVNGKLIYEKPIDYKNLITLVSMLEEKKCEYYLETSTFCYLNNKFQNLDLFFKQFDIDEKKIIYNFDIKDVLERTLKIEFINLDKNAKEVREYIKKHFGYDNHGTHNAYEIYSNEISKATGIQKVLDYLKLPIECSYAFGDGLNDIEMIQYVGTGVAMGNAKLELKRVADDVCGNSRENGLEIYLKTIE